jgi:hypothetical protein
MVSFDTIRTIVLGVPIMMRVWDHIEMQFITVSFFTAGHSKNPEAVMLAVAAMQRWFPFATF